MPSKCKVKLATETTFVFENALDLGEEWVIYKGTEVEVLIIN